MRAPRERVPDALRHRSPDRIPFTWGFGATLKMVANLSAQPGSRGLLVTLDDEHNRQETPDGVIERLPVWQYLLEGDTA